MEKKLFSLLESISPDLVREYPEKDVPVCGIAYDSRAVQPGMLFFALKGGNIDGHRFIHAAIENGAAAIVGTEPIHDLSVPYIQVADARQVMAHFSAAFYDYPANQLTVIGVTGTDGKTTTVNLIYHILLRAGIRAGMISTVNAIIGGKEVDTGFHVTTPEAPEVQKYLAMMVEAGLTHVVLEATSHGLSQHRVTACNFDVGVVTNITHEHLDYHKTYEDYRAAKGLLFSQLGKVEKKHKIEPLAVLNKDDSSFEYLRGVSSANVTAYSLVQETDLCAKNIQSHLDGFSFEIKFRNKLIPVKSHLFGEYNVANCLAAFAATVVGLGVSLEEARTGIESMSGVPGRMEQINLGQTFSAIVDFAHTPNALKNTLETARKMTSGKIIAVFGSAGLRDREKRRIMAKISAQLADITILTAEDPRTESLNDILNEMGDAAECAGAIMNRNLFQVPDRGAAIEKAVQSAKPGDMVIVCGKGHEQSMCFGEIEYAWDDRTALKAALAHLLEINGPQMPYLPTQGG